MVVDGIAYTFGVFLNTFCDDFNEGPGKVAWVGSLLSGMYLTAGEKETRQPFDKLNNKLCYQFAFNRSCGISARKQVRMSCCLHSRKYTGELCVRA